MDGRDKLPIIITGLPKTSQQSEFCFQVFFFPSFHLTNSSYMVMYMEFLFSFAYVLCKAII